MQCETNSISTTGGGIAVYRRVGEGMIVEMLRQASADLLSEAAPVMELGAVCGSHLVRWTGYVKASVLARARLDFRCWRQLFIIRVALVPSNAANMACAQHVMWLYSVGREALKH